MVNKLNLPEDVTLTYIWERSELELIYERISCSGDSANNFLLAMSPQCYGLVFSATRFNGEVDYFGGTVNSGIVSGLTTTYDPEWLRELVGRKLTDTLVRTEEYIKVNILLCSIKSKPAETDAVVFKEYFRRLFVLKNPHLELNIFPGAIVTLNEIQDKPSHLLKAKISVYTSEGKDVDAYLYLGIPSIPYNQIVNSPECKEYDVKLYNHLVTQLEASLDTVDASLLFLRLL